MTEILSTTTFAQFVSAAGAATLATGLVLAVVLLADFALARRVSARVRAALYLAVFIRLALPLGWASPLGLLGRDAAPQAAARVAESSATVDIVAATPATVA